MQTANGFSGRCRICGCTDVLPCEVLGLACVWVQEDLCSACATVTELLASEDAGAPWLIDVMGEHCARVLLAQMQPPLLVPVDVAGEGLMHT